MNIPMLKVPQSAVGGIVTIGNFDGVHRGHQAMLEQLTKLCHQTTYGEATPAVVVTFDPHPVTVLKPNAQLPRLTSIETRIKLLKQFGADEVIVLPVTSNLLRMSAQQFFHQVIVQQVQASGIIEGPDFRFGKDREGDTQSLKQLCETHGLSCTIIDAITAHSETISSTGIRRKIQLGQLTEANELFGHFYRLTGVVRKGAERGRTLGFPTANLEDIPELIPADGVYAARTQIAGRNHCVAVHIGPNPTFAENNRKVECHVLDFDGDLYNQPFHVDFISRLRDLQAFHSADDLIQQLNIDLQHCRHACQVI